MELSRQQYQSQLLHVKTVQLETVLNLSERAGASTSGSDSVSRHNLQVSQCFDIRKIVLIPLFREREVDTYLTVFEGIAATLQWPLNIWPLMLQCKPVGKAQEVCSTLILEQSLDYDAVKNAVLRSSELLPEAC